ncbi:MAG: hypothetical protein ACK4TI_04000 [Nitrososphaerales archaeon]
MADLVEFFKARKEYYDRWEVSKKKQLKEWRQDLAQLMAQIYVWLQPVMKLGLKIRPYTVSITEQVFGTYEASALELNFGPITVQIKPKALAFIGVDGRVDIESPQGMFYLIRRPGSKEWFLSRTGWWDDAKPFTKEVFEELIKEIFA